MYSQIVGAEGQRDLVLLHGGIGTGHYHWSKLVKGLSAQARLHLPDLPGHGRTLLPEGGQYDRDVLVQAVQEYLEPLAPVDVAAFSMGGHTSLALAETGKDLFASLTLVGVSVREHDGLRAWRQNFDPDVLEREYPVWARHLSKIHAPLGGPDAWKDVCRRDSRGMRIDVDVDALRGLECPVMLVRGDRDTAADAGHYAELRRVWPQADEFVVPGGGHDVQLTRARIVEPVLVDFLKRAGQSRRSD
jgi:3-oxoadipate enol-lactonase